MPRYAHLVMGPAGSGKSTYCSTMLEHLTVLRRSAAVVNLDPAAEHFSYPVAVDIRDLIEVSDVMEPDSLCLGPNGGLVFCMEHLVSNPSWLELALGQDDDDYLLIDCPGQVELYTHLPVMNELVSLLQRFGIRVCAVFLLDSHFMMEAHKYVSGMLTALSCMISLEVHQVNVLTKMDLLSSAARKQIYKFMEPDLYTYLDEGSGSWASTAFKRLSKSICDLVDDYSLVRFTTLDRSDESSVGELLSLVDTALQYGEEEEPREAPDADEDDDGLDNFLQNS